jgi:CRISPR type III-B/RAMP module-associated protein Cmr5
MAVKTLGQARAKDAWGVVEGLVRTRKIGDEADHAKKLPMRIKAAGLAQSLAFLRAKKYAPEVRGALSKWVMGQMGKDSKTTDALLEYVIQDNASTLRRATAESLAWLEWFNRFADPYRKDEKE